LKKGLTRNADNLPPRMLKELMPDGTVEGMVVDLKFILDQYCQLRGWDRETGIPTGYTLMELDLTDIAPEAG